MSTTIIAEPKYIAIEITGRRSGSPINRRFSSHRFRSGSLVLTKSEFGRIAKEVGLISGDELTAWNINEFDAMREDRITLYVA